MCGVYDKSPVRHFAGYKSKSRYKIYTIYIVAYKYNISSALLAQQFNNNILNYTIACLAYTLHNKNTVISAYVTFITNNNK